MLISYQNSLSFEQSSWRRFSVVMIKGMKPGKSDSWKVLMCGAMVLLIGWVLLASPLCCCCGDRLASFILPWAWGEQVALLFKWRLSLWNFKQYCSMFDDPLGFEGFLVVVWWGTSHRACHLASCNVWHASLVLWSLLHRKGTESWVSGFLPCCEN